MVKKYVAITMNTAFYVGKNSEVCLWEWTWEHEGGAACEVLGMA
jgi:hypothetical protein